MGVQAFSPSSAHLETCRSCGSGRLAPVLDLGAQPLANALVDPEREQEPEALYPLKVVFCEACGLLQVDETVRADVLFNEDYPYFSSFIPALLAHSRDHALQLIEERRLTPEDLVVEVASNDGYLLRNFLEAGVPVLGVDPADGPVRAAIEAGVPTRKAFFGADVARQLRADGKRPSVMIANNVLAHVDSINDFVEGFAILLADDGIAEFEFPYARDMVEQCAFDTIYHEHVFYYSLTALERLFGRHGLHLNDVTRLSIHGGSLRLRVSRSTGKTERLRALQAEEVALGMDGLGYYSDFGDRVRSLRDELRAMIGGFCAAHKKVAAYGAAAKGATLLNFAQLPAGAISFVVDRNTHKVGKLLPGVHVPIRNVDELLSEKPDYCLILTWNFADEIVQQQRGYLEAGGVFLRAVPHPEVMQTGIFCGAGAAR